MTSTTNKWETNGRRRHGNRASRCQNIHNQLQRTLNGKARLTCAMFNLLCQHSSAPICHGARWSLKDNTGLLTAAVSRALDAPENTDSLPVLLGTITAVLTYLFARGRWALGASAEGRVPAGSSAVGQALAPTRGGTAVRRGGPGSPSAHSQGRAARQLTLRGEAERGRGRSGAGGGIAGIGAYVAEPGAWWEPGVTAARARPGPCRSLLSSQGLRLVLAAIAASLPREHSRAETATGAKSGCVGAWGRAPA